MLASKFEKGFQIDACQVGLSANRIGAFEASVNQKLH